MRWTLFLCSLFLFGACCTKKDCDQGGQYNHIELQDFQVSQIDTIYVKSYQRNTGFTVLTDSLLRSAYTESLATLVLRLPYDLNPANDYVIEIPSFNKSYSITEVSFGKEVCNDCLVLWHSYFEELKSYEVNGVIQFGNQFYIRI